MCIGLVGLGLIFKGLIQVPPAGDSAAKDAKLMGLDSVDVNPVAAVVQGKLSETRTELSNTLATERAARFDNERVVERKEREDELIVGGHKISLAQQDNSLLMEANTHKRIESATNLGLTPEVHQWKLQTAFQTDEEIRRLKEIEDNKVEADFKRQMNTIRAILAYQHLTFDQVDEVRARLIALIEEEGKIEGKKLPPHVKGRILQTISEAQQMYQEVFRDFKDRLHKAGNGSQDGRNREVGPIFGRPRGIAEPSVENELPLDPTGDWLREGFTEGGRERAPTHNRHDERG
jgi:hypothetical protein